MLRDSGSFDAASLELSGERIGPSVSPPADAPPWFAIPGLRNAHVHLDLSFARGVKRATRGFGAWVLDLLAARGPFNPSHLQRAAMVGAAEALASGTTAVGDIDSSGAAASAVAASGLKGVSFHEVLGSRDPEEIRRGLVAWIEGFSNRARSHRTRAGVSPHAPYSTPASLYELCAEIANRIPVAYSTHIAETLAEGRFLASGDGEFKDLLDALGARSPFSTPPGMRPLEYLSSHGRVPPGALLAHVNYCDPSDFEGLRTSGAIVVYCPRSHNFFGHRWHPVREMLDAGVCVALGTDSIASNSSLSMFEEMAFLRAARPDLSPAETFSMATRAAANLLDGGSGRLDEGESADLVVVEARGGVPSSLVSALDVVTSGAVDVVATIVGGEVCFARGGAEEHLLPLTRPALGVSSFDPRPDSPFG